MSQGAHGSADAISPDDVDLTVRIGTCTWKNPIGTASGTYGKGLEFRSFYDVRQLGFIVVKTITPKPRVQAPFGSIVALSGNVAGWPDG